MEITRATGCNDRHVHDLTACPGVAHARITGNPSLGGREQEHPPDAQVAITEAQCAERKLGVFGVEAETRVVDGELSDAKETVDTGTLT